MRHSFEQELNPVFFTGLRSLRKKKKKDVKIKLLLNCNLVVKRC